MFLYCVPLDTRCLTRDGSKPWDQVQVGDETLGFNPDTDRLEWTPIFAKVVKPAQPVVELAVGNWRARVTPGHRWWSERRTTTPVEAMTACPVCGVTEGKRGTFNSTRAVQSHAAKAHGLLRLPRPYARVSEFVRTDGITKAHRLRVAARLGDDGRGNDRITDDEAALLGWIVGDGTINHAARTVNVWIFQAKPRYVNLIDALLADFPHSRYVRDRNPGKHLPSVAWRLRSGYARGLLERSELLDRPAEDFVLSLSAKQRERWLEAVWQAEGWTVASGPDGEVRRISQNAGPWADAMTLAVFLEGNRPTRHLAKRVQPQHSDNWIITFGRPWIGGTVIRRRDMAHQPVWCVETGLGTWTMEQDGVPMITGNSTRPGTAIGPRPSLDHLRHLEEASE